MIENNGQRCDVAVIGAGITGLSIAWHLAELQAGDVAMFDGRGIGSGATAIQPGGVRQQWGTPIACRMAREAHGFYRSIDERLTPDVSPGFTSCGYLFLAEAADELAELQELASVQRSAGVPVDVLSPQEAVKLVPGLGHDAIVGASYCAEDGYFDRPQSVVAAFAAACERASARLVTEHVRSLQRDGEGWRLSLTDGSVATAGQVVVAAGSDSASLLAALGIELPIVRESRYLFYSDPIRERLLEPLVVAQRRRFAAKQLADGSVLASDLAAEGDPKHNREQWHRHIREAITAVVPILEYVSFPVLVEGDYDVTPDNQPVLGRLDGQDGLWIAAGLNGRGLMMAPVVGRMLAEAMVRRNEDETLQLLSASRFARGDLVPEQQVV